MFFGDVVCCLVRLICQAGRAYSKTGRIAVKKKYIKSCLSTPARFNFFKNQSRLAAFDVVVPLQRRVYGYAEQFVFRHSLNRLGCYQHVDDSLLSGP